MYDIILLFTTTFCIFALILFFANLSLFLQDNETLPKALRLASERALLLGLLAAIFLVTAALSIKKKDKNEIPSKYHITEEITIHPNGTQDTTYIKSRTLKYFEYPNHINN